MSKPLFFTGRKEISISDVAVRLVQQTGVLTRFEARLDFRSYDLAEPDADVILEAYHNTYLERFHVGRLGLIESSAVVGDVMRGLEPGDKPSFRVKVISTRPGTKGQLLAAVDKVNPETDDESGASGSLLPLIPKNREQMQNEFWRIRFLHADELKPELWINKDVSGLFTALQNQDPRITALIMPEVLRQVLRGLVEDGAEWTEENTLGKWLLFAKELYDEFEPWDEQDIDGSRQRRRDWVDEVVQRFAAAQRFFDLYHEQPAGRAEEVE